MRKMDKGLVWGIGTLPLDRRWNSPNLALTFQSYQVEILTHFGPHRRLWMGPQFAFKTFQHTSPSSSLMGAAGTAAGDHRMMEEEELLDLDISLPSRPHEQSNPVSNELTSQSHHSTTRKYPIA